MTMDGGNRRGVDMEQTVNDLVQESKLLEAYYNDVVSKESVLHRLYEESHNSFEALRSLSSEAETLSLVPLGIGVYVKSLIYPLEKVLASRVFNWIISQVTGVHLHDFNCGFKVYRRWTVTSIK